ncbi:hypothetical protein CHARACLAT_014177 [Characodon lateralis]|uniref:Uncharacterized protein n=1 Tax=Characodon lateralis TaxID=208331 RepID=A0ABU7DSL4_9TELE|nr:hypothetical protein [Characodon lateralis]
MDNVHSLTLTIHTLRFRYQYPRGATSPQTQTPNQSDPGPDPELLLRPQTPTTPVPFRGGGHVQKRGPPGPNEPANQTCPRRKQSQTPNEFRSQCQEPKYESPHRATNNQYTDIEHMPPNPNAMNALPTGTQPDR